ncbi:MAG: extracellular solute-binding protein [Eubacteriales bacterium]|nr:extracellular solute-binding protein [Eubacteriales bacterium]
MKRKNLAKAMAGVLCAGMLLNEGVQIASAEESGYQTTYGDKQFDDVTITVEIFDRSNAPTGTTLLDNRWTEYINQEMNKVGITVEFVGVPRSEETTKVQTMLATGSAPDIIFLYGTATPLDYFNQGGTVALNDYVDGEDQARNLKEYITDEVLDIGRDQEGNLFAIPARRSTVAVHNLFIRQDWLDELGLAVPTTVDEFYDVLKAFKENYPDCIPFITNKIDPASSLLNFSFMESVQDEKSYNENYWNQVYKDDGTVEYFRYLNKLYNDGLMDPEYYTVSDVPKEIGEKMLNGQVGAFTWNVNANVDTQRGSLLQTLRESEPEANYVAIAPFENINDGNVYNQAYSPNGASIFIPQTAKNVEACITYLDWLATQEGGFTLYHGFEGEHFEYIDGVPVVIDSNYNATDKDWISGDLFLVGNSGYFMSEEEFSKATAQGYGEWADYVLTNYEMATTGTQRYQPTYTAPSDTEYSTEIDLINEEYWTKSITCSPDNFDAVMTEYRAALEGAGAEEIYADYCAYYATME